MLLEVKLLMIMHLGVKHFSVAMEYLVVVGLSVVVLVAM